MVKLNCLLQAGMVAFFIAGVTLSAHSQIKNWKGVPITAAAVDQFLKEQMDSLKIPALSIALINDGQLVYHRTLGVADLDTRKPVNDSSLFEAASLSKPLFSFFVMKMVEKGYRMTTVTNR